MKPEQYNNPKTPKQLPSKSDNKSKAKTEPKQNQGLAEQHNRPKKRNRKEQDKRLKPKMNSGQDINAIGPFLYRQLSTPKPMLN